MCECVCGIENIISMELKGENDNDNDMNGTASGSDCNGRRGDERRANDDDDEDDEYDDHTRAR